MDFKDLPNYRKADLYRKDYMQWKQHSFKHLGFFPVFQPFKNDFLLKKLSGNAFKLYVYLGLNSANNTGDTWVSIETMCQYFDKSPRTISNWIEELLKYNLIKRLQLNYNESAYTFLRPYGIQELHEKTSQKNDFFNKDNDNDFFINLDEIFSNKGDI